MARTKQERLNFNFSRGINTDAPAVGFPVNFSVDEENFDIRPDGSRRRRRGLQQIGLTGTFAFPHGYEEDVCYTSHKWPSVGGDPLLSFIIVQMGRYVYFYEDTVPFTSHKKSFYIDIGSYLIDLTAADTAATEAISVAIGLGSIFIVHPHMRPLLVEYNSDDTITVTEISMKVRLFELVEDGIDSNTQQPGASEITDQYRFNLANQGWTTDLINQYYTDKGKYPSKNMIVGQGHRRAVDTGYYDADGVKEFSSDKLAAELFQDALAPMGHIIITPFDTYNLTSLAEADYTTFTRTSSGSLVLGDLQLTITLNKTAHGLSTGDYVTLPRYNPWIGGGPWAFNYIDFTDGVDTVGAFFFNGETYPVTVVDANNITITITVPDTLVGAYEASTPSDPLYVGIIASVSNEAGLVSPLRPSTNAWYAGRAWYAGTNYSKLSAKIFFSQVVESRDQYGKCYQVADPTSLNISDILPTDGGVISIPEAGAVYKLLPYSSSLLVFADNGVWQIGPGGDGYFTATSYSIRKVSDIGTFGPGNVVMGDGSPYYWGKSSIYKIGLDPTQGFLVSAPISLNQVDVLYGDIPADIRATTQGVYNDLKKQIVWSYRDDYNDNEFNLLLIYDLRFQAFLKWRINIDSRHPVTMVTHKKVESQEDYNKLCIVALGDNVIDSIATVFNNGDDYKDYDTNGTEVGAYLVTGYDVAEAPAHNKQAPVIHVFMYKTETGFTEVSGDLVPVNASSLTMQARWNWADRSSSGKWGTAQECYRHRRLYTATDASDGFDDGQPVVVTRNKVRGRGNSLHLKFTAGSGKDAHLIGWATNYTPYTDN